MKKFSLAIVSVILLLSSSLAVNSANATNGWSSATTTYKSHSTLNQIGKTKICGDHICKPFEYENMKKILKSIHKNNVPYFFQKSNKTQ